MRSRGLNQTIFVVTPTLDVAATIDRTLKSVFSQRGQFSIRYHVQDGGSVDATIRKLRKWEIALRTGHFQSSCSDFAFTWSSDFDDGMYDAIQTGFDQFDTDPDDLMTWINGDDVFSQDAFRTVMHISREYPDIKWVGGAVQVIDERDRVLFKRASATPTEVIRKGLCDGLHWHHLQQEGMFFKKSLWFKAKHALRGFRLAGDWSLWREFSHSASYHQVEEPLGSFRAQKNQLSIAQRKHYEEEIENTIPLSQRSDAFRQLYSRRSTLLCNIIKVDNTKPNIKIRRQRISVRPECFSKTNLI